MPTDSQANVYMERTKDEQGGEHERGRYGHKKSLSDATMLIHSSEDDDEDNDEDHSANVSQTPLFDRSQLRPVIETFTDESESNYPYSSMPVNHLHIYEHKPPELEKERRVTAVSPVQFGGEHLTGRRNNGSIPPSVSESDLTAVTVRYRMKKEPAKKRPVSDVLSGKKDIVEGLPPSGGIKKGNRTEAKKNGAPETGSLERVNCAPDAPAR